MRKLYAEDEPGKAIATFNPAPGPTGLRERNDQRANLMISLGAQQYKDEVVLSLLLVEKDRRFDGKTLRSSWMNGFAYVNLIGNLWS